MKGAREDLEDPTPDREGPKITRLSLTLDVLCAGKSAVPVLEKIGRLVKGEKKELLVCLS